MKTTAEIQIGDAVVEIKSRREDNASGWSIIVFTPTGSLRCVRPHISMVLQRFVDAIVASVDRKYLESESVINDTTAAVMSIIDDER
tara:strand:+ start:1225 stop:1485 length:261 start_codon:yes stop_codon:yes gene_type:complete